MLSKRTCTPLCVPGALGQQAKFLSRTARYAGLKEIKNKFYDILDLAADKDAAFDLAIIYVSFFYSVFLLMKARTLWKNQRSAEAVLCSRYLRKEQLVFHL